MDWDELVPPRGKWRKLRNGGRVAADRCWHCDAFPVILVVDPMCPDEIGVCYPCASRRRGLARERRAA